MFLNESDTCMRDGNVSNIQFTNSSEFLKINIKISPLYLPRPVCQLRLPLKWKRSHKKKPNLIVYWFLGVNMIHKDEFIFGHKNKGANYIAANISYTQLETNICIL